MKRYFIIIILTLANMVVWAEEIMTDDTLTAAPPRERKLSLLRRVVRGFDRLDERYIEPQHYVFTAMLQATHTYDLYTVRGKDGQRFTFAPDGSMKMGPYFGWKWIFAGYTFDLRNMSLFKNKQEFDVSIYSSQIGVDLFYRRTGSDYKLRNASLGGGVDAGVLNGLPFDGVKAGITGINVYYIFNHGRFSYPAAFAQSTCQKISCGSWMAGVGYTNNSLDFDYASLQKLISDRLAPQPVALDSGLMFNAVRYHDFNISAGYAYNWVFAPKWLLCLSGQAAVAYKHTTSSSTNVVDKQGFDMENFNVNGTGRFALVYNNTRWYAGMTAIVRTNNYRKRRFSTNNTYGNMDIYIGYNFGLKKKYRNKK